MLTSNSLAAIFAIQSSVLSEFPFTAELPLTVSSTTDFSDSEIYQNEDPAPNSNGPSEVTASIFASSVSLPSILLSMITEIASSDDARSSSDKFFIGDIT